MIVPIGWFEVGSATSTRCIHPGHARRAAGPRQRYTGAGSSAPAFKAGHFPTAPKWHIYLIIR